MTNAELAILSLLVESPLHGYEIERIIQERGIRDWTEIGFSSIYYLLKKLENEGLIEAASQPAAVTTPARRTVQLSQAGEKAWRAAALQALGAPQRSPNPFLLGLANLNQLSEEENMQALELYRQGLEERRAHVRSRWQAGGSDLASHVHAMFDYSLTMIEAEINWVERFILRLQQGSALHPPEGEE